MKKQRPVNLNLTKINFPITAISSILHRISGMMIFITLGILLRLLDLSLTSSEGFSKVITIMDSYYAKFIIWGILTTLTYHTISGIRHILIDLGCLPETLLIGTRSAQVVFVITILISILAGFFIW